jgi:SAM-dependent methyltransferase
MAPNLPLLFPFPDEIEEVLRPLLQNPGEPALAGWLYELIEASGHLSTSDDLRWRAVCTVWLAAEFDVDKAWPYLKWLNTGEPVISAHLSEILIDGVDQLDAHVQMADWLAKMKDPRLTTFFQNFQVIPAQRKLKGLFSRLLLHPTHPKVGVWLAAFCNGTMHNDGNYLRAWRLLATAWYAAAFNPDEGLKHLKRLSGDARALSAPDNQLLTDVATETDGMVTLIQLLADCPDMAVNAMLKDFGHPSPASVAEVIYRSEADYSHLSAAFDHLVEDIDTFKHLFGYLEHEGISPKKAVLLDLACGPLATQTVLLNAAGYKTEGVGWDIPPAYLPLTGLTSWFKRRQHVKAWQRETIAYYRALADHLGLKLKWNKVNIKLADLTRLEASNNSYEAVICMGYLHQAPDVKGVLVEVARVLKPGGLFLANIRPYAGFRGAPEGDPASPWGHLRTNNLLSTPAPSLNKWREAQFREALERCFSLEEWLPETDSEAQLKLTPQLQAELRDYREEELTRKQIMVVARKR